MLITNIKTSYYNNVEKFETELSNKVGRIFSIVDYRLLVLGLCFVGYVF